MIRAGKYRSYILVSFYFCRYSVVRWIIGRERGIHRHIEKGNLVYGFGLYDPFFPLSISNSYNN